MHFEKADYLLSKNVFNLISLFKKKKDKFVNI